MADSRISHEFSGISGFDLGGSGLGVRGSLARSTCILYGFTSFFLYMHIYIYMYIFFSLEREREREGSPRTLATVHGLKAVDIETDRWPHDSELHF